MHIWNVHGLGIAADRRGQGEPLVFLHGISSNRRAFADIAGNLADDFTVVVWDAPGYGDSSDPPETFSIGDYAETLHGLLETMGLGPVTLLGHSFGAMIVLEVYRRYPKSVVRLILADATLGHGDKPDRMARMQDRLSFFETSGLKAYAESRVKALLSPGARQETVDRVKNIMSALHPAGYRTAVHVLYETDQRSILPAVKVPTLILWGEQDQVTPLSLGRWIHARIAGSRFHVIPSAGHLSYVEQPEVFSRAVREFLKE